MKQNANLTTQNETVELQCLKHWYYNGYVCQSDLYLDSMQKMVSKFKEKSMHFLDSYGFSQFMHFKLFNNNTFCVK